MPCVYAARLRNARKIGWKIKKVLASGGIVFDADGNRVTSCSFRGFKNHADIGLTIDGVVYLDADTSLDNGMHDTIESFSRLFSRFTFVDSSAVRPLVEVRGV